jgi:hypothetical protein
MCAMRLFGVGARPGIYVSPSASWDLHPAASLCTLRRHALSDAIISDDQRIKTYFPPRLRTRKARDNIFFGIIRRGNKSVTLQTHNEFIVVVREDYQLFKVDAKRALWNMGASRMSLAGLIMEILGEENC